GNHDGFVMGNSFIYNEDCPYEAYTDILETSPRGVSILNNYWGTTDTEIIDSKIWDRYDDGLLTYIYYDPILTETDITNPISPPYNLHITGIDNGEISISWDANPESDCDGYRVYWDSDGEWPYANSVDNGTSTTYTITGLAPGTYLIGVSSYDSTYAAVADDPLTHINEKQTQGVESWYAEISADPSPAPLISSDPASFDFEAVMLGDSSSAQTLTITNIGTANLEIGSITVDGDDSSEFTTQNDSCSGQTIEPSGSLTIEIIFTPASSGAKSAYLNIPSNDSYTGDLQIELNGIGGINPDISITPSSLDFGTVALGGGTATRDITITNTGSADLTIIDLSVAGTDGDEFSQTNDYSAPLTPDSSCTVTVGLSPLSTGAKTATLSITSDDPDEPIVDVSLSANVTDVLIYPVNIISLSATPLCSTAPASVDFEIEASGGSGSYDYSWDFGDTTTSDEEDPTHTYDSAGTYSVIVTVSDHENPLLTASSELTITITDDLLPTLNVSISAAPVTGEAPLEVTFTATFEGASPPFDLEWDFGDGTTESQTTDSNTAEITHTYTSAGVYSALLEATSRSESGFDTLPMRIAISISAINNSSEGNGTSNDCGCSSNAYAYSTNIGKGSIVRIASYMLNNFIIMLFPLSIITLHRLIRSRKKRR
ncbi:MAG: choice-of-anchor D domain-containing protein, partial [Spirochaetota bacterium]|nr:choice-of-anchor D domain-containing protein [Spirochaetota bacterium]